MCYGQLLLEESKFCVCVSCSRMCYISCRSSFRGVNPSVRLHLYVVKPSLLDKVQHDIVRHVNVMSL